MLLSLLFTYKYYWQIPTQSNGLSPDLAAEYCKYPRELSPTPPSSSAAELNSPNGFFSTAS